MRRRFRYYERKGWHLVKVPKPSEVVWTTGGSVNERFYQELRTWCHSTLVGGTWEGTMQDNPGNDNYRFLFEHEADATLFALKWS